VEDLYLMESVKSPALFPKEEKLVYERVWIDKTTKKERHSLWLVEGKRENKKSLEMDEPDGRSPVVSPDGEWIAFLSNRNIGPGTMWLMMAGSAPMYKELSPLRVPPVPASSDEAVDPWMYQVKTGKVMQLRKQRGAGLPADPNSWSRVFHDGFY